MTRVTLIFLLSFTGLSFAGCSRLKKPTRSPRTDNNRPVAPAARTETRSFISPTLKCALRLVEMPAYSDLEIPVGDDVESHEIETVSTLASDAERYTLHFSRSDRTAYMTVSGGIGDHIHRTVGPWPIDHPDVRELMEHVDSRTR